jgi:hypothetical protein
MPIDLSEKVAAVVAAARLHQTTHFSNSLRIQGKKLEVEALALRETQLLAL